MKRPKTKYGVLTDSSYAHRGSSNGYSSKLSSKKEKIRDHQKAPPSAPVQEVKPRLRTFLLGALKVRDDDGEMKMLIKRERRSDENQKSTMDTGSSKGKGGRPRLSETTFCGMCKRDFSNPSRYKDHRKASKDKCFFKNELRLKDGKIECYICGSKASYKSTSALGKHLFNQHTAK